MELSRVYKLNNVFVKDKLVKFSFYFVDALTKVNDKQNEGLVEEYPLQSVFEASKKAVIQGSMNALLV